MIGIQKSRKQEVVAVATFASLVFRSKKQAKKKTPTDLDRALSECGPTSPDSSLFLCFLKGFFSLGRFVEL